MLWYLHLCSDNNIIVHEYRDQAEGIMEEVADGSGQFKSITLYPEVIVTEEHMVGKAVELHHQANQKCFIANSLNVNVGHEAKVVAL